MNVSEVMTRNVITVATGTPIADAVGLMLERGISGLPVLDPAGRVVGIITEGDLLRRAELGTERQRAAWVEFFRGPGRQAEEYVHTHGRHVDDVMTNEPITVEDSAPLETLVTLMEQHRIKRVPVVHDGRLVGLVSRADLLRLLLPALAETPVELRDDEICRRVEQALAGKRWAPREGLRVTCENGVVTLNGVILDERERGALRVAAERVSGVKRVHDELIWADPMSGMTVSAEDLAKPDGT